MKKVWDDRRKQEQKDMLCSLVECGAIEKYPMGTYYEAREEEKYYGLNVVCEGRMLETGEVGFETWYATYPAEKWLRKPDTIPSGWCCRSSYADAVYSVIYLSYKQGLLKTRRQIKEEEEENGKND